jgi:hypothetical protein
MEKINNVQDLGYRFASHVDGDQEFIAYATANIAGFPDKTKIADELVASFKAGCLIRHIELQEVRHFIVEGESKLIETDDEDSAGFHATVAYCVSLPKHEFGELKGDKKSIIKEVRDRAKNYCDLRWSRLLKAAADVTEKSSTRASNKGFQEWLDKVLADMTPKAKRALEAGDPTAVDIAKLKVAIEMFKNQLKK